MTQDACGKTGKAQATQVIQAAGTGVIEAGAGGISINTGGAALTNTNSGTTRGIVSTGAITIANAGAIDNQLSLIHI